MAGKTVPGSKSGHELFSGVDVVTVSGVSRRLYVAYNAGIQAWDILTDPDTPQILDVRDGWENQFLSFPNPDEVLTFVLDIAAINLSGSNDLVIASGNDGVGPSIWDFANNQFRQVYQDTQTDSKMVRLVKRNDGIVYAIAAAVSDGVVVYNASAAKSLGSPCLDNQGSNCPTVYRGRLTDGINEPLRPNFMDALHVPSTNKVFVSVAGGLLTNLELWELSNPQFPGTAVRRFSGIPHSFGSALFVHDGHYYLAVITEEIDLDKERLKVYLIDGCINGVGQCSLGSGSIELAVNPIEVAPEFPTSKDFITYSEFGGDPYLYYSPGTGGPSGPDLEQLFDASSLRPPNGSPLSSLPEVTRTGGSYTDPCNFSEIRYWSHYYASNAHGLNNMTPRLGKFSSNGYFYRAAAAILDVHVRGAGDNPGASNIRTDVSDPQSLYWMSDAIGFSATASGDCSPSSLSWSWTAGTSRADVQPTEVFQITDDASYRFDCLAPVGTRCLSATATVRAENEACPDASITPASIVVKDPTIDVVATSTGGKSTFERCETIPLSANLVGRAPAFWEWRIDGVPIEGCSSNDLAGDLEETVVTCDLDGNLVLTENIFADEFETGDVGMWSFAKSGEAAKSFGLGAPRKVDVLTHVDLLVWNSADTSLTPRATEQVDFTLAETGVPGFAGTPEVTAEGPAATLDYPASEATTWTWEFEDPSGEDQCSFPGKAGVACVVETTDVSTITHFWALPGTYSYRVTISNCSPDTASAVGEVTVESGVQPDIKLFGFRDLSSSGCSLDFNNGGGQYCCPANVDIEFQVELAEEGVYDFSFDWEKSSTDMPNFTAQQPVGKDSSRPIWYFKRQFGTSTVFPVARASTGFLDHSMGLLNGKAISTTCSSPD